jgi:thioredoxin 1
MALLVTLSLALLLLIALTTQVKGFGIGLRHSVRQKGGSTSKSALYSEAFKRRAGSSTGDRYGNSFEAYFPSAMTVVSDEDFQDKVLCNEGLNLVFFTSSWCAPCSKMMALLTNEVMAKHGTKANFYICDTDLNPRATAEMNIRSIPSTILVKDSKVVSDIVGAVDDATIVGSEIIKFY